MHIIQERLLDHLELFLEFLLHKIIYNWREYYMYLLFLLSLSSYFENIRILLMHLLGNLNASHKLLLSFGKQF
jgi:hypothetical protein